MGVQYIEKKKKKKNFITFRETNSILYHYNK